MATSQLESLVIGSFIELEFVDLDRGYSLLRAVPVVAALSGRSPLTVDLHNHFLVASVH